MRLLRTGPSATAAASSTSSTSSTSSHVLGALVASTVALSGCGSPPPPSVVTVPAKPLAVAVEPPPDVTAVPEPAQLFVVARVTKPEAVTKTLGTWAKLPLPGAADLVRSIFDDSVADAVDLSQPVDGAVALGGGKRDPRPLVAVSVAVKSFDDARDKLGAKHKLVASTNGDLRIEDMGVGGVGKRAPNEDDDNESDACVLTHASAGARLVCGQGDALEVLAPYLARTLPRQTWPSDLHVEVTLAALREPFAQVRQALPMLARSLAGAPSPALARLVDAAVGEMGEIVDDTARMTLDAQLAVDGLQTTVRVDFQRAQSLVAKLAASNAQKADVPPAAYWHLPSEADFALFGSGFDPKLFEHPRKLLGDFALESADGASMPEAERKALRELVVDRMLGLVTGPFVYGKGYDGAAVEKAYAANQAVKDSDLAAKDRSKRVLFEQVLGWHLLQVREPITKVGPMLKDWAQLWGRPAFVKWAKQKSSSKMLASMRITPPPAGVTLPKDTVHLEIVMPRADLEEAPAPARAEAPGKVAPAPPSRGKKIARRPLLLHILAVPDQGGTWLGLGLDGKLLAQKAAGAASTVPTPQAATLADAPALQALRDAKVNGAFFATPRGFLVYTALASLSRTLYPKLGQLPSKGTTPVLVTSVSEQPSDKAAGGASLMTIKVPRATIEDILKIGMAR